MGLWDTVKKHAGAQFLDVIEWLDSSNDTIVYRFPVMDQAITDNSKLIVREGQAAVFISEGTLSDVFGPGTYDLDTRNAPISAFFQSIKYALKYPYKGDVYFVSTRQFTSNPWGTPNPVMMRDAEFGPVRIRAFGVYSYRITDPAVFIRQIVGTDGLFKTDEINKQLKKKLQSAAADTIAEARIPVLDLAARYMDLGDTLRDRMNPAFASGYGITLTDFTIENISLPEEVEKALDTRTKMGVLGDLDAYTKLKAADAIQTAAANTGLGGAGASMGVGLGVGQIMGQALAGAAAPAAPQGGSGGPPPLPGAAPYHYNGPAGQSQQRAEAVAQQVAAHPDAKHLVWQAGWDAWKPAREVPEIARLIPPPSPSGALYHYHGSMGRGQKSIDEIVALVAQDPEGTHHVWQQGWTDWKPAAEVPEIRAHLGGPPPPPGDDSGGPPPPPT